MNQLSAKRRLFQAFVFLFILPQITAAQGYWQQQVDFNIAVSLNDVAHTLDGQETITYKNNSPDTLHFIWFHLWPNAFKNDRTAFSEQMIEKLSNTAFYFSKPEEKGYINKLAFKVNGQNARLLDSSAIDIAKLVLPQPLAPDGSIQIVTPFHVQLPKNFSRGGHIDQSYQITQWYPKPAVYDAKGWHPMPYLDQGEFYNEFGNYSVSISLPKNYVVASTGQLIDESEKKFLLSRSNPVEIKPATTAKKDIFKKQPDKTKVIPASSKETKTIHYTAQNVTDFAWFADKRFIVQHDTIQLANSKVVDAYTYLLPEKKDFWKNSISFTKRAIHFYSGQLGAYPHPTVNVVCAPPVTAAGGMEYPMVTLVNVPGTNEKDLDITIAHEVGHNWLQGILASNERDYPWMDEGMNTFIERKYARGYYPPMTGNRKDHKGRPLATDPGEALLTFAIDTHTDQPINTPSDSFTRNNYIAVAYTKTALWLEKMESQIGAEKMQQLMQAYYQQWRMKHPQPENFRQVADSVTNKAADPLFQLLNEKGSMNIDEETGPPKVSILYPTLNAKQQYITILPAVGVNAYDKAQIGVLIHNYGVPFSKLHFAIAPLYATGSKQFNFIGNVNYNFYTSGTIQRIIPSLTAARFSTDDGSGANYEKLYRGFTKLAPSLKLIFKKKSPTSNINKWVQWKSFFITESAFDFKQRQLPQDTFQFYALKGKATHYAVHQLTAGIENERSLYPYKAEFGVQQVGDIIRTTVNADYFFNYNKDQGVSIRFFAGKIFYLKTATDKVRFDNYRYHLTMYGPNGEEDYTYSNAFLERNQNTNLAGRQIMIRDGGFKYRSDFSSVRPGRSDDWLAALNFGFDVPHAINPLSVLPIGAPLKVFADVGTYAEAWDENNNGNRFLYSIGLQLSIFKYINVYAVILQSAAFKEPNEVNGMKWWQKRLTLSVDLQNIQPKIGGASLW